MSFSGLLLLGKDNVKKTNIITKIIDHDIKKYKECHIFCDVHKVKEYVNVTNDCSITSLNEYSKFVFNHIIKSVKSQNDEMKTLIIIDAVSLPSFIDFPPKPNIVSDDIFKNNKLSIIITVKELPNTFHFRSGSLVINTGIHFVIDEKLFLSSHDCHCFDTDKSGSLEPLVGNPVQKINDLIIDIINSMDKMLKSEKERIKKKHSNIYIYINNIMTLIRYFELYDINIIEKTDMLEVWNILLKKISIKIGSEIRENIDKFDRSESCSLFLKSLEFGMMYEKLGELIEEENNGSNRIIRGRRRVRNPNIKTLYNFFLKDDVNDSGEYDYELYTSVKNQNTNTNNNNNNNDDDDDMMIFVAK